MLLAHLAEAATAAGDLTLCRGLLAGGLGDHETAAVMLGQSIATARRLGADLRVRQGQAARDALPKSGAASASGSARRPVAEVASLWRSGNVWTVAWRAEHAQLPHVKGLADIAMLVRHRGEEVSALRLAGGTAAAAGSSDQLIDLEALDAYRNRLAELAREIDHAGRQGDLGHSERLESEREHLLAEVRRATGLGGRLRTRANDPAERARKAVTARLRGAIRRVDVVAPLLAAHLDRSTRTGLHCSYVPLGEDASIQWDVQT